MSEQEWWTSPLEDEEGYLIMVTGRADVEKFRKNPKFSIRVEVTIPYRGEEMPYPVENPEKYSHEVLTLLHNTWAESDGMPSHCASRLLDIILENFQKELSDDPVAVLTGIYTGAGERTMVFYTMSTNIFNKKLNAALAPLPLLPIKIIAENDPEWSEYSEMRDLSEIR